MRTGLSSISPIYGAMKFASTRSIARAGRRSRNIRRDQGLQARDWLRVDPTGICFSTRENRSKWLCITQGIGAHRMFDSPDTDAYIERAEMHEQLAATTADGPARKMHLAMAAEYRRKAEEANGRMIQAIPQDHAPNRLL